MKSKIHHMVDKLDDEAVLLEVSRILLGPDDIPNELMDEKLTDIEKASKTHLPSLNIKWNKSGRT